MALIMSPSAFRVKLLILALFILSFSRFLLQQHAPIGDTAALVSIRPARKPADQMDKRLAISSGRSSYKRLLSRHNHYQYSRNHPKEITAVHPLHPRDQQANDLSFLNDPQQVRGKFNQPGFNVTVAPSSLKKRAPLANFKNYVCKGQTYLANMQKAASKPPRFSYADLARNGWIAEPMELYSDLAPTIQHVFEQLRIPLAEEQNRVIDCVLEKTFKNFRGQTKTPLGGTYQQAYNTDGGAILALSNYSPTHNAQTAHGDPEDETPLAGDNLKAVIPNMHSWADVTWSLWAHEAGDRAHNLRYVFHYDIITKATQSLIETIMGIEHGVKPIMSLKLPWPGKTFNLKNENGLALLGSPHGVGIS